jgi:hypothetical protein
MKLIGLTGDLVVEIDDLLLPDCHDDDDDDDDDWCG